DREDTVEAGDFEDLRDVPIATDDRELAIVRAEPLHAAHEDPEGRRVDERRVREVDDDLLATLANHLEELLLELRRRVEVDLACQRDDIRVAAQLLRLDVEVHARPPARCRGESNQSYLCGERDLISCRIWVANCEFG